MAPKMKVVWVSLLLLAMLGCTNLAGAQSDNGETNLSGVWKGTRTTTGNVGMQEFRVRSIQFSLTQTGESLSGSYKCFAGKKANADCANPVGSTAAVLAMARLKSTYRLNQIAITVRSKAPSPATR